MFSRNIQILEALTKELECNEFQMKAFFDLSLDLMLIANDTHFELANPAWERTMGWSQQDLNELPWRSLLHPEDTELTEAVQNVLVVGTDVHHFINRYRCKDETYKTLVWSSKVTPSGKYYCVARVKI